MDDPAPLDGPGVWIGEGWAPGGLDRVGTSWAGSRAGLWDGLAGPSTTFVVGGADNEATGWERLSLYMGGSGPGSEVVIYK